MAKFEKGNKIGNRFSKTNQPKNAGRKPSLFRKLKKQVGIKVGHELSKEDYYDVIRFLIERTPNELDSLMKDIGGHANKNTPIWILNIISAINTDVRYGRTSTIDSLFDRLWGKANADISATITGSLTPDLSVLSTKDLLTYNNLLDKINGKIK